MTKVFCAVDTASLDTAKTLVTRLAETVGGFKLGLEFFIAQGAEGVHDIRRILGGTGAEIFLDLKLHDIPNTVAGAVKSATRCGADFLTVHAHGGRAMMQAAVQAAREAEDETGFAAPKILAVTVLTSLDDKDLAEMGVDRAADHVPRLARLAMDSGVQGVVCAPGEISLLRKELGPKALLVTPGVRPAGADAADQKRVMTPREAALAGADYIVVGRPITGAKDPAQAARDIVSDLERRAA